MLVFKRNFSLSVKETNEIKLFIGQTIESVLTTKEETLNIFKKYDLALICSCEGNYVVVDIYQLSKFALCDKKTIRKHNVPFYTAARSLNHKEETIVYLDDHKEKGLRIKNLQAFYYICELLDTLDIDVYSMQEYKCVW